MQETPAPSSVAADPALITCHSHHSSPGAQLPCTCHLSLLCKVSPETLERGWAAGKEGCCWQRLQMLKSISNPKDQNNVIETLVESDFTPQITPSSYQWKHWVFKSLSRWCAQEEQETLLVKEKDKCVSSGNRLHLAKLCVSDGSWMGAEQCLSQAETLWRGAEHKSMPLFRKVPQVLATSIANHCFLWWDASVSY